MTIHVWDTNQETWNGSGMLLSLMGELTQFPISTICFSLLKLNINFVKIGKFLLMEVNLVLLLNLYLVDHMQPGNIVFSYKTSW